MTKIVIPTAVCICAAILMVVFTDVKLLPDVVWGTFILAFCLSVCVCAARRYYTGIPIWLSTTCISAFPGAVAGYRAGFFGQVVFAFVFAGIGLAVGLAIDQHLQKQTPKERRTRYLRWYRDVKAYGGSIGALFLVTSPLICFLLLGATTKEGSPNWTIFVAILTSVFWVACGLWSIWLSRRK